MEPNIDALVKTSPGVQSDAAFESRRFVVCDWSVTAMVRGSPPVLGLVLFVLVWQGITTAIPVLSAPAVTWETAVALFVDPFYRNGPNDQDVGWNVLASLARVGAGFGMAAVTGIPAGFLIGCFAFLDAIALPIINLLRPVSSPVWLSIGLLLFKSANPAAIWAIFIYSIWLMMTNTAVGVTCMPWDCLDVVHMLNLSEQKVFTCVLFPAVLSYMLAGVRLSIGTAWPVIVTAEMFTSGVDIGFWLWDEWNNLKVEHIVVAIFVIDVVGLLFEHVLLAIARRLSYDAV